MRIFEVDGNAQDVDKQRIHLSDRKESTEPDNVKIRDKETRSKQALPCRTPFHPVVLCPRPGWTGDEKAPRAPWRVRLPLQPAGDCHGPRVRNSSILNTDVPQPQSSKFRESLDLSEIQLKLLTRSFHEPRIFDDFDCFNERSRVEELEAQEFSKNRARK